MKPAIQQTLAFVAIIVFIPMHLFSQQRPISIPNPMSAHTIFIFLITAGFLAWAASYSIQLLREQEGQRKSREGLLKLKESILEQITALENDKESGTITVVQYKTSFRKKRGELARVLGKLQHKKILTSRR